MGLLVCGPVVGAVSQVIVQHQPTRQQGALGNLSFGVSFGVGPGWLLAGLASLKPR